MSNVMVRFKKTYYKVYEKDNKLCISFTKHKKDNSYCANAFINRYGFESKYIYIGAYPAVDENGKLVSKSGNNAKKMDLDLMRSMLNRYEQLLTYDKYMYLYLVLILLTKNMDVAKAIGGGGTAGNGGSMNDKGLFYGGYDCNKALGIENIWSTNWTILDNAYIRNNSFFYRLGENDYDYYKLAETPDMIFGEGFISKLKGNNNVLYPVELNGSSNKYVAAKSNLYNGLNRVYYLFAGGSYDGHSTMYNLKSDVSIGISRITC